MRITFLNMQREVRKTGRKIMHETEAEYDDNEGETDTQPLLFNGRCFMSGLCLGF